MLNQIRLRAFVLHLTASVCLAVVAVAIVIFVWYPSALHWITGVMPVLAIVLGVDVILGPALTAVVFKPGKPHLWVDISLIISVQVVAFCYGMWVISAARPAWIVFTGHRFDLVQANDIDVRFVADAARVYQSPPWSGPRWVGAKLPVDLNRRNQLIFESLSGGPGMPHRPDLYVSLDSFAEQMKSKAIPLSELMRFHGADIVPTLKRKWPSANGYFPLVARQGYFIVLVDRDQAKILGISDLRPFK